MQKPNIVFIISDDTRLRQLGCYGGAYHTPAIDALASRGVRFNNALCPASVCTASRFSYLTGQHCGHCTDPLFFKENPIDDVYTIHWNLYIRDGVPTMGSCMRQLGYHTGYFGKWHTGYGYGLLPIPDFDLEQDPDDPATDAKLHQLQRVLCEEVERTGFDEAGGIVWGNNECQPIRALRTHHNEWSLEAALNFLDHAPGDKPFLLHYASTCLHGPDHTTCLDVDPRHTPGGTFDGLLDSRASRKHLKPDLEAAGHPVDHETCGLYWLDLQVHAIMEKLEEKGVADNTVVIYCGDHGGEPGKGSCYDTGVRIPFIIHWPGQHEGGRTIEGSIQNIDVLPTLIQIAGGRPSDFGNFDGTSILPVLEGTASETREYQFLENGHTRAIRTPKWKLLQWRYPRRILKALQNGELNEAPNHLDIYRQEQPRITRAWYPHYFDPDQLYDLENDPAEQHNLAGDPAYAEVLSGMKARLREQLERFAHPFPEEPDPYLQTPGFEKQAKAFNQRDLSDAPWWEKVDRMIHDKELEALPKSSLSG